MAGGRKIKTTEIWTQWVMWVLFALLFIYILTFSGGSERWRLTLQPEKININTAVQAELESLPGIGEARAKAIIAYRESEGSFDTLEEIMDVPGIGEGIYADIKNSIALE
jgi:comEA protein